MAQLLRVAIAGASGRMGRMLIEAVDAADDLQLAGALDMPGSPALGQDAAAFLGRTSGVAIAAEDHRRAEDPIVLGAMRRRGVGDMDGLDHWWNAKPPGSSHAPVRVDSYEGRSGRLAARLRELGIKSEVSAPVVVNGEMWGALIAGTDQAEPQPADTEARGLKKSSARGVNRHK